MPSSGSVRKLRQVRLGAGWPAFQGWGWGWELGGGRRRGRGWGWGRADVLPGDGDGVRGPRMGWPASRGWVPGPDPDKTGLGMELRCGVARLAWPDSIISERCLPYLPWLLKPKPLIRILCFCAHDTGIIFLKTVLFDMKIFTSTPGFWF